MVKTIYAIPGLAADERMYEHLHVPGYRVQVLKWFAPTEGMTLKDYAKEMSLKIRGDKPVLLGVSLGGIMAQLIGEIINCQKIFLVSTLLNSQPLPVFLHGLSSIKIHHWIHWKQVKMFPNAIKIALKGTEQKYYIPAMLRSSDEHFNNWAVEQILNRETHADISNTVVIHGNKDIVFPPIYDKIDCLIDGGNHFMIIDRYKEINAFLYQELYHETASHSE